MTRKPKSKSDAEIICHRADAGTSETAFAAFQDVRAVTILDGVGRRPKTRNLFSRLGGMVIMCLHRRPTRGGARAGAGPPVLSPCECCEYKNQWEEQAAIITVLLESGEYALHSIQTNINKYEATQKLIPAIIQARKMNNDHQG